MSEEFYDHIEDSFRKLSELAELVEFDPSRKDELDLLMENSDPLAVDPADFEYINEHVPDTYVYSAGRDNVSMEAKGFIQGYNFRYTSDVIGYPCTQLCVGRGSTTLVDADYVATIKQATLDTEDFEHMFVHLVKNLVIAPFTYYFPAYQIVCDPVTKKYSVDKNKSTYTDHFGVAKPITQIGRGKNAREAYHDLLTSTPTHFLKMFRMTPGEYGDFVREMIASDVPIASNERPLPPHPFVVR